MKRITLNEQFILVGSGVYSFVQKEKGVSLKFISTDYKIPKKKEVVIPTETDVKKYASDNGYNPNFMWERMKGYIDAGMTDSQGNQIKNWKLKLNQVWFVDANKVTKDKPTIKFFQNGS